ncbi:hypothetical protein [Sphingomonas koreensis]
MLRQGLQSLFCTALFSPLLSCSEPADEFADAKGAVRQALKDPSSAVFTDLRRCGTSQIVQGEVNAKNSLGGFVGPQAFVYQSMQLHMSGTDGFIPALKACTAAYEAERKAVRERTNSPAPR